MNPYVASKNVLMNVNVESSSTTPMFATVEQNGTDSRSRSRSSKTSTSNNRSYCHHDVHRKQRGIIAEHTTTTGSHCVVENDPSGGRRRDAIDAPKYSRCLGIRAHHHPPEKHPRSATRRSTGDDNHLPAPGDSFLNPLIKPRPNAKQRADDKTCHYLRPQPPYSVTHHHEHLRRELEANHHPWPECYYHEYYNERQAESYANVLQAMHEHYNDQYHRQREGDVPSMEPYFNDPDLAHQCWTLYQQQHDAVGGGGGDTMAYARRSSDGCYLPQYSTQHEQAAFRTLLLPAVLHSTTTTKPQTQQQRQPVLKFAGSRCGGDRHDNRNTAPYSPPRDDEDVLIVEPAAAAEAEAAKASSTKKRMRCSFRWEEQSSVVYTPGIMPFAYHPPPPRIYDECEPEEVYHARKLREMPNPLLLRLLLPAPPPATRAKRKLPVKGW